MKKAIRISIPEPCHEDWAKMTPTEKGKFCSVCTKEVFDFTETSDEELVKRVTQGKNLCGRFKKSQLDRPVVLERKSGNSLLPYAASLLMPLSVLASSEIKSTPSEKPFISLGIGSHPVKSIIKVSGYVADENGKAIENAEVQILDSTIKVFTNKKGYFSLKCASGSKLFVKKGILQSETITLGSSDENVTIPLFTIEVQNNLILGRIAPKEIQEEVIVVTSGDFVVEDSEKENVEKPQDTTNVLIKGTVTDESNLALPGVNIIIKGTTHGTQTDFDGNYSIEAEPNQTLVFSYVGYETKEIILSNINNEINISMEPDMDVLGGEIVVIAGGISYSEEGITNPYQPYNYYDDEQRANREERRTYAKKVKAFQKVKAERKKEARQLKKNNRKK